MIQKAIGYVSSTARDKGLDVNSHLQPDVPIALIGNGNRLLQVLRHLLQNAVKFTESGTVTLHVARESGTKEESVLQFSVRDTGTGIPRDQQENIFHHFTQLEAALTRKHGGLGLGLTVCKRYVPLIGGRIWLESEEGRGSTFYFTACFGIGQIQGLKSDPTPSSS